MSQEKTMAGDYEVVREVSCPKCDTRNWIGIYSKSLRPICGKCKASLEPVLQGSQCTSNTTLPPSIKKSKRNVAYILIGLVIGAFFITYLFFQQKERSQPLPLNNEQYSDKPVHEPKIDHRLSNGIII